MKRLKRDIFMIQMCCSRCRSKRRVTRFAWEPSNAVRVYVECRDCDPNDEHVFQQVLVDEDGNELPPIREEGGRAIRRIS